MDGATEVGAIAKVVLDLVRQVADAHVNRSNSLTHEVEKNPLDDWSTGHLEQRLRSGLGEVAEPRASSSSHDQSGVGKDLSFDHFVEKVQSCDLAVFVENWHEGDIAGSHEVDDVYPRRPSRDGQRVSSDNPIDWCLERVSSNERAADITVGDDADEVITLVRHESSPNPPSLDDAERFE